MKIVRGLDIAIVNTRCAMAELDTIAINLVALDGHKMKLKGEDRLEAIRMMAARNVSRQHMAWRLGITVDSLERVVRGKNIKLPTTIQPAHWTVDYLERRDKPAARERARRKRERERHKRHT